jgi:hypothetical protein
VVLRALSAMVPGDFYALVPHALALQREGFEGIAAACERGEGDRAAAEYATMMLRVASEVVSLFRRRGLFDAQSTEPR